MLSRLLRVSLPLLDTLRWVTVESKDVAYDANALVVIARNALAQEESQDFNPDFPETIPINMNEQNQGCSC